jgi:SAM-dependent methyltransferase
MRERNAFGEYVYEPREIVNDPSIRSLLGATLLGICRELGFREEQAHEFCSLTWTMVAQFDGTTEAKIRAAFDATAAPGTLEAALRKRAANMANQVRNHVVGPRLLDIGCGDGMVAWSLRDRFSEAMLLDVSRYLGPEVNLPFRTSVEGKPLPVTTSYDTSLLLTVLHHAADPLFLWSEVRRVTSHRIIAIESVIGVPKTGSAPSALRALDYESQRKYASFVDWLYNRVFHSGVPVPYNYRRPAEWNALFSCDGWSVRSSEDLGIDQPVVPEHHFLFVVERSG